MVTELRFIVPAFLIGMIVSGVVSPLTARVARRLGIVDRPEAASRGYKRHAGETPYLGGVAIAAGIGAGSLLVLLLADASKPTLLKLFVFGGVGAASLALLGLVDDVRSLPPIFRLLLEIGAATGAWALGFRVELAPWDLADYFLTVAWIVGITNAFNLLDNMDGLSAGIAAVAGASFAAMGVLSGNPALAIVSAALCGASLGFLLHNRHPAKLFMGDSDSLLLGFLLALIGVRLEFDNLLEVTFLVPVVVLGIPIFDTMLVVAGRLSHGRAVFTGGRDHVSHRLVAIGLPVREAVRLLYWSGLCLGWLGIVITRSNVQVGWMLLGFVAALGVFLGNLLWKVPVYDISPAATTPVESVTPPPDRDEHPREARR